MKNPGSTLTERNTLDVLEQSFVLLRRTPSSTWALYFLGSVPFLFLILYFWTDMSYNPFAGTRAAPLALVLALAFLTMKVFHAFFSRSLLASLSSAQEERLGLSSFLKEFRSQAITQTVFILSLPATLLTMVPFAWQVAFFEHWPLTAGQKGTVSDRISRTWELARRKPKENHLLLWLTSPLLFVITVTLLLITFHFMIRFSPGMQQDTALSFSILSGLFILSCLATSPGCTVAACNIGILAFILPGLLRTFLGIETSFSLSGTHFFNTTFILTISILAYLATKPLNLAVYVIRHFLSQSIRTGADLKASILRHCSLLLLLLLGLGCTPGGLRAETASPPPMESRSKELRASIEKNAGLPEYAWRLPKLETPDDDRGILEDFFDSIGGFLKSAGDNLHAAFRKIRGWLEDWFEKWVPDKKENSPPVNLFEHLPPFDQLGWILMGLTLLTLAFAFWLAYRYRQGRRSSAEPVVEAITAKTPDISDENTTADQLPSDEWLLLAERLIQKGNYRPALRALYLGLLARLALGGFFTIHPAKSNCDYRNEFSLQTRRNPEAGREFNACVFLFERCWYGTEPVDAGVIRQFQTHYEQLRNNSR